MGNCLGGSIETTLPCKAKPPNLQCWSIRSGKAMACPKTRRMLMFEPLTRKFIDWRQRRITIRKLRALDDRILADLGIERDTIPQFVARIHGL